MDTKEVLQKRKSVRAFTSKPVERETIELILNNAKHSPSGVNMQPWEIVVASGATQKALADTMTDAFASQAKQQSEYQYYPSEWFEPYKSRRKETGLLMYKTLGIEKGDTVKQHTQWVANYRSFGAPSVVYCFIDNRLQKGSYLDYGMFLQSIMLVATSLGVGSCAQAALADYGYLVREKLGVAEDKILLCGIALGYEDKNAPINSYRTNRLDINEFATFYD